MSRTQTRRCELKSKRPQLSQIQTVDELRYWLPIIKKEIQTTLAQTTSTCYTDKKVEALYKRISELQSEHRNFRKKIAELELGPHVNVLVNTIPIEKQLDFYTKKRTTLTETLDDFFREKPVPQLLAQTPFEIIDQNSK